MSVCTPITPIKPKKNEDHCAHLEDGCAHQKRCADNGLTHRCAHPALSCHPRLSPAPSQKPHQASISLHLFSGQKQAKDASRRHDQNIAKKHQIKHIAGGYSTRHARRCAPYTASRRPILAAYGAVKA